MLTKEQERVFKQTCWNFIAWLHSYIQAGMFTESYSDRQSNVKIHVTQDRLDEITKDFCAHQHFNSWAYVGRIMCEILQKLTSKLIIVKCHKHGTERLMRAKGDDL